MPSFAFAAEASGAADFVSSSSSSSSAISSSEAPATQLERNCKRTENLGAKQSFEPGKPVSDDSRLLPLMGPPWAEHQGRKAHAMMLTTQGSGHIGEDIE